MHKGVCCIGLVLVSTGVGCSKGKEPELSAPAGVDAGSAPAAAAPVEEDSDARDRTWVTVSANNQALLRQLGKADGFCETKCTIADQVIWESNLCLGKKLDLRFVGNDCEKAAVMHQLPEPNPDPSEAVLVHVYRRGALEYPVHTRGVVRSPKASRPTGSSFYWIAGALGQPGSPPRYSADGNRVEFETLDGKKQNVPLLASSKPQTPDSKSAPARKKKRKGKR
ncbi:MAG: hypothetical protein ACT4TC_15295 [Myxococcaceae bacterium]